MDAFFALLMALNGMGWPHAVDEPEPGPCDGPGAFLYEAGVVSEFAIEIGEEEMDELSRNGPDVRATLSYSGLTWEVGLKLKGSSTYQDFGGKPSIKIDMEAWVPDQKLLGVRRFTFNSMVFDPSMMREHAAYWLYAQVGAPAPRHGYARLTVNGEDYGLYGVVETLDEQWLRRLFPGRSEGNLYDSTYTNADLTGYGVGSFVLEEGDPAEPYEDLRTLVDEIDGADILEVLDERFDRDRVLGMLAVDIAVSAWDGYSRNTNNYLLYHALPGDRWYLVPWGQDTTFRGGGSLYAGVTGRLTSECLGHRECKAALEDRIVEVLDAWEGGDLLGYTQRTWAVIEEHCEDDPKRTLGCDADDLFDALADRPERIRDELGR